MKPEHCGWLEKYSGGKGRGVFRLGNVLGKWDTRYLVLDRRGMLCYFKSDNEKSPAGQINCNGGLVEQNGRSLSIATPERVLTLRASSEGEAVAWICALAVYVDGGSAQPQSKGVCSIAHARNNIGAEEGDLAARRLSPVDMVAKSEANHPWLASSGDSGSCGAEISARRGGGKDVSNPSGATKSLGGDGDDDSNPFASSALVAELVKLDPALKDDVEVQGIQRDIDEHEVEIDASTQRMLMLAMATREQGATTLEVMHAQGDQLKRIEDDQDRVQQNLDTGDNILKNMTSVMGWRTWGVKAARRVVNRKDEKPTCRESSDNFVGAGTRKVVDVVVGSSGGSADGGGSQVHLPPNPPGALDIISGIMTDMHQQALCMNTELKSQSGALDIMVEKTEKQNTQTSRAVKATASVGGKEAKQVVKYGPYTEVFNTSVAKERPVSSRMAALRAMQQ